MERHALGNLIAIRGNHEEMMVGATTGDIARASWLEYGGTETLRSYGVRRPEKIDDIQAAIDPTHWRFIQEDCVDYHETATHFFVHAGAEPDLALEDQDPQVLRWKRFHGARPHMSGKIMVCGHTPQATGLPSSVGHAVCIDTGVYARGGWLTCLDIQTGEFWQANQKGAIHRNSLYGKFATEPESLGI